MRQSGRANWVALVVLGLAVAISLYVVFSGESPSTGAAKFMTALADGNAEKLTELSYFSPPREKDAVLASWKRTLDISEHYQFAWRITGESKSTDTMAKVALTVIRNLDKPTSYEETFNLDLVKVDGNWKVDVAGLSREMFPALPR